MEKIIMLPKQSALVSVGETKNPNTLNWVRELRNNKSEELFNTNLEFAQKHIFVVPLETKANLVKSSGGAMIIIGFTYKIIGLSAFGQLKEQTQSLCGELSLSKVLKNNLDTIEVKDYESGALFNFDCQNLEASFKSQEMLLRKQNEHKQNIDNHIAIYHTEKILETKKQSTIQIGFNAYKVHTLYDVRTNEENEIVIRNKSIEFTSISTNREVDFKWSGDYNRFIMCYNSMLVKETKAVVEYVNANQEIINELFSPTPTVEKLLLPLA